MTTVKRQCGFTLVEVMVALTIVALALPALMTLISSQSQSTMAMRDTTFAYWVAENEMTRLRLLQQIAPQERLPQRQDGESDMLGRTWHWELETEATEVDNFYRVDLRVSADRRSEHHLAQLSGFFHEQP